MRQRPSTIISLTVLLLGVPVIALAQAGPLNVASPVLSSVTLAPTNTTGGLNSTGQVNLVFSAPSGGRVVQLSSSNTAVATVPASVTVPGGEKTASFSVTTFPVAKSTDVTITATAAAGSKTAVLTVLSPNLSSVTLLSTNIVGGHASFGQVRLDGPAPAGGLVVQLSSSNSAVATTVPASVTVSAGAKTRSFAIATSPVPNSVIVTITATAFEVTRTAQLTVAPPVLSSLTLAPTNVSDPFGTSTGQVSLSGPAPLGGFAVQLSSSVGAIATVPASVTVAAGATTASFAVTYRAFRAGTAGIAAAAAVTITATADGVTKTAVLTVNSLQ